MRSLSLILVTLALAAAGCVGKSPDPPVQKAKLCSDDPLCDPPLTTPPPAARNATAPLENVSAPATRTLPVQWSSNFEPGACVFVAVAGLCPGLPVEAAEGKDLGKARGVASGTLTFTWTEDAPVNHELGFSLATVKSCGQGCTQMHALANATIAHGVSPVKLEIKAPVNVTDGELGVFVWKPCEVAQDPVFACAYTNQAFKIEGTLVVI